MDSEDGTLSVSTHSSGTLSDAERSAIANLADGFQKAIDGLGAYPPQLDLSGLTQYDTSVLSSVNMQFNVTGDGASNVSANISLSGSARSVSLTNPEGTFKLNVDMSDSALSGSGAQRDQAIASYLAQFDNANAKGHGDTTLMSMFKDAFTQMNSDYGASSKQLPGTSYAPWLVSDVDTPTNNSSSTDLLALPKPLFIDQETEQNSGTWK